MAKRTIGRLKPRYSFMLNSYKSERLSRCPKCKKLTHLRKFVLFIDVDHFGPLAFGKTCRYCTPCELIMAHEDELDEALAINFRRMAPEMVGKKYMVLGTVDKKIWTQCISEGTGTIGEMLKHIADFKKYYDLHVEPGGWRKE